MESEGNRIIPILNVLTIEQQEYLVSNIKDINKNGINRSIIRYGISPYLSNRESFEIPTYLNELTYSLLEKGYLTKIPESITINIYNIGDSISAHVDRKECGETISILSLLSSADMVFTLRDKKFILPLPPLSMVHLNGVYRYTWKHSIPPVKEKRISIVFR